MTLDELLYRYGWPYNKEIYRAQNRMDYETQRRVYNMTCDVNDHGLPVQPADVSA